MITVIGGGPGKCEYMLPAAQEAIAQADIVIADQRYISEITHENLCAMGPVMAAIKQIGELSKKSNVAVVVSGDPLMYSLYKTICKNLPDEKPHLIPGIGSMQFFAARLGETLENAVFLSVHGRNMDEGRLAFTVAEHEKIFILCDKERGPAWIGQVLAKYGFLDVCMCAGSYLSYEHEVIKQGVAADFIDSDFESLSVVFIKNTHAARIGMQPLLKDEDFIRGKTPMTKEEIRWMILGKLGLTPTSIVWDIGAGTGSVSVECARQCPFGHVYAVERYQDAAELICKNKEKFNLNNMTVLMGMAAEKIEHLPVPTHVFIGGSGRELPEIIKKISELGEGIRVIVSCVTIETLTEAVASMKPCVDSFDMVQANVSRSRALGQYHILESNNPITLVCGVTKKLIQS